MDIPKDEGREKLLACRVCLAWDEKLYNITEIGLHQTFTNISGITLSQWDGLPHHVCMVCRAALAKARALRARSLRADALLKQALVHQQLITNQYITTIDRSAHKLTHNLKKNNLTTTLEIQHIDHPETVIKDELDIEDTYADGALENDIFDIKPDLTWPENNDSNEFQIGDIVVAPANIVATEVVGEAVKSKYTKRKSRIKRNLSWPDINDSNEHPNEDIDIVDGEIENNFHYDIKTKSADAKVNSKKQKLTKKNKFSTQEDIKEFEDKYEFNVKCLTEEEMVEDMERRKQSEKYVQGEYKCELCFRGFSTATAYENHVKDKHDPNIGPNECHLCHARYRFAVNRNQHIQDAHRLQFRCRRCDQLLPGEPHAVEHAAGHAGATFKCRHCDKRFHKKTTCATHMRLEHPEQNAAGGSCEVCGETFISRTGLNCHKTRAHNKPYNPKLHCRKCRMQFDNIEALQRHKVERPGNKCDPHGSVCCACGEWCRDGDELVLHQHSHHGTPLFSCDQCGKSFLSKLSLCTHRDRVHRGVRPARAPREQRRGAGKVCETCGKTFQCLALLKQHQARHSGDRPFKCELCPKSYATAAELRTHRVHHTGEKPHKCERCSKCYGTAAALKVHVEAVHIRQRQYCCSQCPKTFLRATALSVHKVVHTGEKRFECALCGAKFTQAGSLATHRKYVHLKLKPPPRRRAKAQEKTY